MIPDISTNDAVFLISASYRLRRQDKSWGDIEHKFFPYEGPEKVTLVQLRHEVQGWLIERHGIASAKVSEARLVNADQLRLRGDIRKVGEALHGEHWMGGLAHDLHVGATSIERWVRGSGLRDLPPRSLRDALNRLLTQRGLTLEKIEADHRARFQSQVVAKQLPEVSDEDV